MLTESKTRAVLTVEVAGMRGLTGGKSVKEYPLHALPVVGRVT